MRRIASSLTLKLVVLVGVFIALPAVLYGQFELGDRKMRELVGRGIQHQSWLVAQALKPVLDGPSLPSPDVLDRELKKFASDGATLNLMLHPSKGNANHGFYFVASSAPGGADKMDDELNALLVHGVLDNLSQSCSSDIASVRRYVETSVQQEMLTWVMPIQSPWGCWALVASHPTAEFLSTSVGRAYWQTPEVRLAAVIYLLMAMVALLAAVSVVRSIGNFRRAALAIIDGRVRIPHFAASNTIPELRSVARVLDRLVADLSATAREIREAAEDTAHSLKGPVATIDAALAPLRRLAAGNDERAQRSLALVDSSLRRLEALIAAAQRVDTLTANMIDAPRTDVNLTQAIQDVLARYRELMAARDIALHHSLADDVVVSAGSGAVDAIFENLLDNAISFSPRGGAIIVTLRKERDLVALRVDDEGPGIDPRKIGRVFERYVSLRPPGWGTDTAAPARGGGRLARTPPSPHAGLGLWIVRRNVELLGGRVVARNRPEGGLSVRVVLPLDRSRPLVGDGGCGTALDTIPDRRS